MSIRNLAIANHASGTNRWAPTSWAGQSKQKTVGGSRSMWCDTTW